MMNVQINENKGKYLVQAGGTTLELAAYCGYVLHSIYQSLRPEVREHFRKCVEQMVNDPDFGVWEVDSGAGGADGIRGVSVYIPKKGE